MPLPFGSPIDMDSTKPHQVKISQPPIQVVFIIDYMLKSSQQATVAAVEVLHYGYPALSLLYFIFSSTLGFCTTAAAGKKKDGQYDKRRALLSLMILVVVTYVSFSCPEPVPNNGF